MGKQQTFVVRRNINVTRSVVGAYTTLHHHQKRRQLYHKVLEFPASQFLAHHFVAIGIHTVQLKALLGQINRHYRDVRVFAMIIHGSPRFYFDWIEISVLAHYDADQECEAHHSISITPRLSLQFFSRPTLEQEGLHVGQFSVQINKPGSQTNLLTE